MRLFTRGIGFKYNVIIDLLAWKNLAAVIDQSYILYLQNSRKVREVCYKTWWNVFNVSYVKNGSHSIIGTELKLNKFTVSV